MQPVRVVLVGGPHLLELFYSKSSPGGFGVEAALYASVFTVRRVG
jgi:hypothetical protein